MLGNNSSKESLLIAAIITLVTCLTIACYLFYVELLTGLVVTIG